MTKRSALAALTLVLLVGCGQLMLPKIREENRAAVAKSARDAAETITSKAFIEIHGLADAARLPIPDAFPLSPVHPFEGGSAKRWGSFRADFAAALVLYRRLVRRAGWWE